MRRGRSPNPACVTSKIVVGIQVLGQRRPAHHAERHHQLVTAPDGFDPVVRSRDHRRDVGGDRHRGREFHRLVRRRHRPLRHRPVRTHQPPLGGRHLEHERRLQVRLLEAREHAPRVGRLVLGVEVGLSVDRVGEAVQPLPRTAVAPGRPHRDDVTFDQPGQGDPGAVVVHRHLAAVDRHGRDLAQEVQPGLRRGRRELDGGRRGEAEAGRVWRAGQIQFDANRRRHQHQPATLGPRSQPGDARRVAVAVEEIAAGRLVVPAVTAAATGRRAGVDGAGRARRAHGAGAVDK